MYTLSDVKSFCNSIAPNMEQTELNAKLIEASDIMDKIFDDTDKLYIDHKLDSIPWSCPYDESKDNHAYYF